MESIEITCPACGEIIPYARRCRKCGAVLGELDTLRQAGHHGGKDHLDQPDYQVSLIRTPDPDAMNTADPSLLARPDFPWKLSLKIMDLSGHLPEKIIPLDAKGPMTLTRWSIKAHGPHRVLSVYFYVSSAGQDLDTWMHFDLDSGAYLGFSRSDETDANPSGHLKFE